MVTSTSLPPRLATMGPKHQRLSQFLVEAGTPGLKVSRKLSKTGMWASDTAELVFEDVRVPNANLLGEEGRGFYQLASGLQSASGCCLPY